MKTIIFLTTVFIFTLFLTNIAQNIPTTESKLKVLGNCDMCKTRIEKSVNIPEVKYAKWDKHTKNLKVIFETTVTSDSLLKRIAAFGHDNEKFKAPDSVYKKLPKCCLYRDNPKTH